MTVRLVDRLRLVGRTLSPQDDWNALRGRMLYSRLAEVLGKPEKRNSYLILSVVEAAIPTVHRVEAFTREWAHDGVEPIIRRLARRQSILRRRQTVTVRSGVLIDVTDTSTSDFVTGIQRVARETVSRWIGRPGITLVRWDRRVRVLRQLTAGERGHVVDAPGAAGPGRRVVIPFNATFVLPEIAVDRSRADRIRSIAMFGSRHSVAIGFDCIPVTSAETAGESMPGVFSRYLSSLVPFTEIVAISASSAVEFTGWKRMLAGAGLDGPRIHDISLPVEAGSASKGTIASVREDLGLTGETVVLAVGSHEPRKNHLNLLHAAELSWRAGHDFTLVFAGGNAWKSERFVDFAEQLRRRGRKIVLLTGVDDSVIWALYSIATVSVFCSFNEGFGLPVVESLASGTPVITSDFGSMKELGEGHGALTVDPRDPAALAEALDRIFSDVPLYQRLLAETKSLPRSTWDDYAGELWNRIDSHVDDEAAPPDEQPRKSRSR